MQTLQNIVGVIRLEIAVVRLMKMDQDRHNLAYSGSVLVVAGFHHPKAVAFATPVEKLYKSRRHDKTIRVTLHPGLLGLACFFANPSLSRARPLSRTHVILSWLITEDAWKTGRNAGPDLVLMGSGLSWPSE